MFNNNQSNIDNITSPSNTEQLKNSLDVNNKLKIMSFKKNTSNNSNNNYLPVVNESHISLESNSETTISKSITSLNSESDHTI